MILSKYIYLLSSSLSFVVAFISVPDSPLTTHTFFFIFFNCWHKKKKILLQWGEIPLLWSLCAPVHHTHIWCTPQNTLRYKSGRTSKNCQSKIVFFCFFILPIIPSPFMSIRSPLFISLFLGPLFIEQWRQSGIP